MISQTKTAVTKNKCTYFDGHFDDHANQAVQQRAHRPRLQVQGYPRCYQMPTLGKYLPRIAPADVMVIDFGSKNQVVALCNRCFKASVQKSRNGPSTQLIEATSCVERSNATIQAKQLSYLSINQTLTAEKICRDTTCARSSLKGGRSRPPTAVNSLTAKSFRREKNLYFLVGMYSISTQETYHKLYEKQKLGATKSTQRHNAQISEY